MNLLPVHKKTWSVSCPRTAHPCQFTGILFINTWIKNVAFLPSAPSPPTISSFIFSWKEPPVSFGGPLLLFLSSALYSWILIPSTSQKWLYFIKAPSLSSFMVFQQKQGQLTLFSGKLPILTWVLAGGVFLGPPANERVGFFLTLH